jgi:voltage-gated potassium channel
MRQQASSSGEITSPEERWLTLHELEEWLETPMVVLSLVWLLLVIVELVWGQSQFLEVFGATIWAIFIGEFSVRLALAPQKSDFLKRNWITMIALVIPALRLVRAFALFRVARAARGIRLVKIVGTANRSINALRKSLGRRALGYVLAATVLVTLLGAAGMLAFEPATSVEGGFRNYAEALWWTAMLLTTMGSAFWPQTGEGRTLCLLLALYGFTVFGYITASFATFFIGQEANSAQSDVPAASDISELKTELARLRSVIERSSSTQVS